MDTREILSSPAKLFELAVKHGEVTIAFENEQDAKHFWNRIRALNHTKGKKFGCVTTRTGSVITSRSGASLPKATLSVGKPAA